MVSEDRGIFQHCFKRRAFFFGIIPDVGTPTTDGHLQAGITFL